jgi:class 3 adenylate cyclase/predicted ATPase
MFASGVLRSVVGVPMRVSNPQKTPKLLDRSNASTLPASNETSGPSPASLKIGDCEVDLAAHTFIDGGGQEIQLTRGETALLSTFVGSPRRVLSRDQLGRAIGGRGAGKGSYDRRIDMLIARLRRKIEPDPKAPRFIVAVPGAGYRFAVQPQPAGHHGAQPALGTEISTRPAPGADKPAALPRGDTAARHSEPERRQVTALSCVLVGLPTIALTLDPEEAVAIIRRFQELCSTIIAQWGGVVAASLKGSGNILALFGHPKGYEDDAERAVHAALELIERVGELPSPLGEPLRVRCAVATGLVLIGEDQTPIGEATLIARQLRSLTPPNTVTVTARTHTLLGSAFVCADPELYELQEVSAPVAGYRITGKRPLESRLEAKTRGRYSQFVGRRHELQVMMRLWERVKAGKGQVALVCGEPGIGKSRLCRTWFDRIVNEPHTTLRLQGSPYHTNSPFYPVTNQLARAARFAQHDKPDLRLKKLERLLSEAGTATLEDTPLFAHLLSLPTDGSYPSLNVAPQRQRELTIAAMLRQIVGLAVARPVVLEASDVHWLDASTLELLNRCIASIVNARILVVCTFRPEFFPQWLDQSHVTILRLDRLSRDQTGAIVGDVAGGKELPTPLREQIISKADGVPLFAEELTKAVMESRILQNVLDPNAPVGAPPSLHIPATLLGSLTARLDRLGPHKEIAQIGAVIGREFSYALLDAVLQSPGSSLESALAHIAACELIFVRGEPPHSTCIFKHALARDAAYATLVRSKRQQLHGRVADALIAGFPETVETQPELIAYHLEQAELTEQAIAYLRKAAQRAIERSANEEAIGHLSRALQLLQSTPDGTKRKGAELTLELMRGQAMMAARGYAAAETEASLLRAKALIDDSTEPSLKFSALYGLFACRYVGGKVNEQWKPARELVAEAKHHDDRAALSIAHRALGTTSLTSGEFSRGLQHLEQALAFYDAHDHAGYRFQFGQDIGVAALCYLSWAKWHLGCVDEGLEVAAEAIRRAEETSHPHTLVYAICHAGGFIDLFRRRYDKIGSYASAVISRCSEHGLSHWTNCGRIFEGWSKICRGNVDQGIDILRAGIAAWQGRGARLWLPFFLTLEAEGCLRASQAEPALQAIEAALVSSKNSGERWALAEVLRVKARILQAAGAAKHEIENVLLSSLEIARSQNARSWELRTACDLARTWQGQGQETKAQNLLRTVYNQFTQGFDTADLRDAKALLGSARQSAGKKRRDRNGKT